MGKLKRTLALISTVAMLSTLVVMPSTAFAAYYDAGITYVCDGGHTTTDVDCTTPAFELSRGQVASMVSSVTNGGSIPVHEGVASFTDVAAASMHFNGIEDLKAKNYIGGYTDASGASLGTFGPNDGMTKLQFGKILVNSAMVNPAKCAMDTPAAVTFLSDLAPWGTTTYTAHNADLTIAEALYCPDADGVQIMSGEGATGLSGGSNPIILANAVTMIEREFGADAVVVPGEPPVVIGGDLSVAISGDTPAEGVIPGSVENAFIGMFDVTAGDEDVNISSLKFFRGGLNNDGSVVKVALFSDGQRVSKAKSFSSGDDMANVTMLDGGLMVKAGETLSLSAVAEIGDATTFSGQSFYLSLAEDGVYSTADNVLGSFPVNSETMAIASVDAAELQVLADGIPANVKVGQEGVKVTKFKLKNNDSTKEISFSGITFKEEGSVDEEDELGNFVLYVDGDEVASADSSTGKYVSFVLDSPIVLEASKQVTAYVKADILGGPNSTMFFQVDSDLDVIAEDGTYGWGAKITATGYNGANDNTSAAERVDIEAGEVTVVAIDAENTDIRQNKPDTIIGTLRLTTQSGKDLELEKLEVNITNTNAGADANTNLDDIMENVEFYVEGQGTFDLACTGTAGIPTAGITDNCGDSDLGLSLNGGETIDLVIRADIRNIDNGGGADLDMTKVDLEAKIQVIGTSVKASSDLYIIETNDDGAVTDIVPSSVTFRTLNGTESTATVAQVTQSATKTVVIGSTGVEGLIFELESGNASDLEFDGATAVVNLGAYSVTDMQITAVFANTDSLNIDNGDCVVTFTNGGTENLDCSNNLAVIDSAANATAIAQAGRLALLTNLSDYRLEAGAATDKFRLVYDNAAPIAGNVARGATGQNSVNEIDAGGGTPPVLAATNVQVGTAGFSGTATNTHVTKVTLYKDSVDAANKLDSVSGSQLSSGVATFEGFTEDLAANGTYRYYVTLDVVDDENQAYDALQVELETMELEDDDSDTVVAQEGGAALTAGNPVVSDRAISIVASGTLSAVMDNTDPATNSEVLILGGTDSFPTFVGSVEFTAVNEAMLIRDITISEETGGTLSDHIEEVTLYKEDQTTEIASKAVVGDSVTFTDVNYLVNAGSENIYIAVKAHTMGQDESGAEVTTALELDFQAVDAAGTITVEGNDSGEVLSSGSGVSSATEDSNGFFAVPVRVSEVALVGDESGETLATQLLPNVNTVAIVKVATDNSSNSDSGTGGGLETLLTQLKMTQSRLEGTDQTLVTALTIERIGGDDGVLSIPASAFDVLATTDSTVMTVTALSLGDTGITWSVADAASAPELGCTAGIVTGGTSILVNCDTNGDNGGQAQHDDLAAALIATGLVNAVAATPATNVGAAIATQTLAGGSDDITFDMDTLMTSDYKISNGGTVYYVIKATVTKDGSNINDDFVKYEFPNLASSNVVYKSDDPVANNTAITDTRLDYTSLAGTVISE